MNPNQTPEETFKTILQLNDDLNKNYFKLASSVKDAKINGLFPLIKSYLELTKGQKELQQNRNKVVYTEIYWQRVQGNTVIPSEKSYISFILMRKWKASIVQEFINCKFDLGEDKDLTKKLGEALEDLWYMTHLVRKSGEQLKRATTLPLSASFMLNSGRIGVFISSTLWMLLSTLYSKYYEKDQGRDFYYPKADLPFYLMLSFAVLQPVLFLYAYSQAGKSYEKPFLDPNKSEMPMELHEKRFKFLIETVHNGDAKKAVEMLVTRVAISKTEIDSILAKEIGYKRLSFELLYQAAFNGVAMLLPPYWVGISKICNVVVNLLPDRISGHISYLMDLIFRRPQTIDIMHPLHPLKFANNFAADLTALGIGQLDESSSSSSAASSSSCAASSCSSSNSSFGTSVNFNFSASQSSSSVSSSSSSPATVSSVVNIDPPSFPKPSSGDISYFQFSL